MMESAESDTKVLQVDSHRLWGRLLAMAEVGATAGGGSNRPALTDEDIAGRRLLISWAGDRGMVVRHDAIGNMFLRTEDDWDHPAVQLGSHLDTQPTGGRFDGVYGVLGGFEVVESLLDHGVDTGPIEIAVWTNEEGSRFPISMLGSAVWSGTMAIDDARLVADRNGTTVGVELDRHGFSSGDTALGARQPVRAAFELHIEQGPVLEDEDLEIGIVEGVQGLRWFEVTIDGEEAHAGPIPMARRRDPVLTFVDLMTSLCRTVDKAGPMARLTAAQLHSEPASPNTVPGTLGCTIDLRHPDVHVLDHLEVALHQAGGRAAIERGTTVAIEERNRSEPIAFDPQLVGQVEAAAAEAGRRARRLVSGAGHDACYVATVAPTAMIFVPCAGGVSHNEAESITKEQAAHGADVLYRTVRRVTE